MLIEIGGMPLKDMVVGLLSGADSGAWVEDSRCGSWDDEKG